MDVGFYRSTPLTETSLLKRLESYDTLRAEIARLKDELKTVCQLVHRYQHPSEGLMVSVEESHKAQAIVDREMKEDKP